MIFSYIWHKYHEGYFQIVIRSFICQISRTNHAIVRPCQGKGGGGGSHVARLNFKRLVSVFITGGPDVVCVTE